TVEDEETYIAVQIRRFEALLFTVDGSLKTCLFSQIPRLLQTAFDLANGELAETDVERKRLFRLLARCWEAYLLIGSEEILRLILEIYEATPSGREAAVPDDERLLERLFFESVALAPDKRRRLKPNFFSRSNAPAVTSEAMSDYAAIRATWLALAATRHVDSNVNKFHTALVFADAQLPEIAKSSFARLNNASEESIRLVNILTLSLSMWCRALRFNPLVMRSRISAGLATKAIAAGFPGEADSLRETAAVLRSTYGDLPELIEAAEDAVLLAAELNRGARGDDATSGSTDYLMGGLARELCAMALASVVMANKYSDGHALDEKQIERVNDLIRISNEFLEDSLPRVSTSSDLFSSQLVSKVESLMKLCGLIWNEFGLERLRDFMNIRRVHFHAVCMMSTPDDSSAQNALVKSLGQLLNEPDFSGIMANLVVSESLTFTQELEVYYLIHAAELGLSDRFGQNVRNQLCLAAILAGHHFSYPLDPFTEHLLVERSDLASLLLRYLKSVPEEALESAYLKLMNATKLVNERNTGAAMIGVIAAFANTIKSPEVKLQVAALLDSFETEQQIRKGLAIDVPALLSGWSDRTKLWLYPGLLSTLFGEGYGSAVLQKEAVALLENRDPANDQFNTYFLLSISLAQHLLGEKNGHKERLIVKNYLKTSLEKWKFSSSADTNVRSFQLLYYLEPTQASDYKTEIDKWQMVKLERDHLKSLPRLLKHGQLFLVFQYYCDAMGFWGLRADIGSDEAAKQINIPSDERRKRACNWRAAGAPIPEPLIGKGLSAVVSSRFLTIGSDLFSAPISEDANFDREREMLNDRAKAHLHNLLGLILGLPDLPLPAKDLIRGYTQRLETYTLPTGP
ncbi:MAG TPA: hypothetical protein VHQ95_00780, partial [Pyrinomonadaceae bacterium]|nr:hypothetical protein [Pyrinomonadaceae bacterium]